MTETDKLKAFLASGNHRAALKMAARWRRLGEERVAIQQGWAALTNPRFYQELGKDPVQLVAAGVAALQQKWGG